MEIPYTTKQMLEKLSDIGIKFNYSYINNVILNPLGSHPLQRAKLGRGMWRRSTVDRYIARKKEQNDLRQAEEAEKAARRIEREKRRIEKLLLKGPTIEKPKNREAGL